MKLFRVFLFGLIFSYSTLFANPPTDGSMDDNCMIANISYGGVILYSPTACSDTCYTAYSASSSYTQLTETTAVYCDNFYYENNDCYADLYNVEFTLKTCPSPQILNTSDCSCVAPPECTPPEIWDTNTSSCVTPPECTTPPTKFPPKASNEKILFQWKEPDDKSSQCTEQSGRVQSRIIDCKTEYRCVKEIDPEKDPDDCRNQTVGSYVSPTAGVFHEDIALVGTDIGLHYQSDYLSSDSIARGWSLDSHHTLDGDYLHLGNGKLLNISSYKSLDNNITTISLGDESYIFDSNNLHISTKDNFTNKTLYTFTYNANNKLISIADSFNNITTLQRDTNDIVSSITAPHGQINHIYVDESGDLINVTYEDNSNYSFTYENHLMISEKEPKGNEFIHEFDEEGKIIKVTDAENGIWSFSNTSNDTYTETKVTKADGDEIIYQDYFLENGSMVTKTTIASGDTFNSSSSVDGTTQSSNVCGVETTISYQADKDPITHKMVPNTITVTTPSGLSKTTNFSQNYTLDGDTPLNKQTTTTINEATTTTNRDYANSTMTITSPEGRVSTITYDADSQLPTQIKEEGLEVVEYTYDEEGRVTNIKQGLRTKELTYDERGNLKTTTDATGALTQYSYDEKDRLTTIVKPNSTTQAFEYDANDNMKKLNTPNSTINQFTHNGVNKKSSWQSPLGYLTQYSYDKQRRVTKIEKPSGKTENFTYTDGRLTSIQADSDTLTLSYSCADKLQSISNSNGESILYTYDGDLLTKLSQSGILSQSIDIAYNNNFLPSSLTYAGSTEQLAYDKDGLLTQSGEANIQYNLTNTYNDDNISNVSGKQLHISTDSYDGILNYNLYGELKSISNNIDAKRVYSLSIASRDNSGKILSKTEHIGKKIVKYNYTYDSLGRLTKSETTSGNIVIIPFDDLVIPIFAKNNQNIEEYTYDNNGNRLQAKINSQTTTASYTLDDNLEVYGDNTYRYDEDGYLVEKTTPDETINYTYNTQGALTSVTTPTKTINYHLNALNQRVAKKVDGEVTEKYLWLNLTTLLAIYDKDDNLVQRFNYAQQRMPISMTQENETYYLHYDQVGTLKAVTDKNQNIIKEITYDTFGNILQDTNPNFKIPFGFAGGLQDRDTNLVHFGYREYDPQTGKWTAKDPIDFSGGDSNLYGYVLGDPVGFVDPEGLSAMAVALPIAGGTAAIDGPLPIGDLIGLGIIGGALIYDAYFDDGGAGSDVYCASEHTKGKRSSTKGKHQKGQSRKNQKNTDKKRKSDDWYSRK